MSRAFLQRLKTGRAARMFPNQNEGKLADLYSVETHNELGKGAFGVVNIAVKKATGERVAVKFLSSHTSNETDVFEEIRVHAQLQHANIVRYHEVFVFPEGYYVVMELVTGGELLAKLAALSEYSEAYAVHVVTQLLHALAHMHTKDLAHLDVKPENILLSSTHADAVVKLADFGIAKEVCGDDHSLRNLVGSYKFTAPEVAQYRHRYGVTQRGYGRPVDVWSAGVILYEMLSGIHPFDAPDDEQVLAKVETGHFGWDGDSWDGVSREAKALIARMLTVDADARATAAQCLQHAFVQQVQARAPALLSRAVQSRLGRLSRIVSPPVATAPASPAVAASASAHLVTRPSVRRQRPQSALMPEPESEAEAEAEAESEAAQSESREGEDTAEAAEAAVRVAMLERLAVDKKRTHEEAEARRRREAEERHRVEEEARKRKLAEAKVRAEDEARRRREADETRRKEAEAKGRAEEEARRREAEAKERAEEETRRRQQELETKRRNEEEERSRRKEKEEEEAANRKGEEERAAQHSAVVAEAAESERRRRAQTQARRTAAVPGARNTLPEDESAEKRLQPAPTSKAQLHRSAAAPPRREPSSSSGNSSSNGNTGTRCYVKIPGGRVVALPLQRPVALGRGAQWGFEDARCPEHQADLLAREDGVWILLRTDVPVVVYPRGRARFLLSKGQKQRLEHGDGFTLLQGVRDGFVIILMPDVAFDATPPLSPPATAAVPSPSSASTTRIAASAGVRGGARVTGLVRRNTASELRESDTAAGVDDLRRLKVLEVKHKRDSERRSRRGAEITHNTSGAAVPVLVPMAALDADADADAEPVVLPDEEAERAAQRLDEAEFRTRLGMSKTDFGSAARWKQHLALKKAGFLH